MISWWQALQRLLVGRRPDLRGLDIDLLLGWLDDSPLGLLVVDRWNRIQHLSPKARSLLHTATDRAVQQRYLIEVVRCHQLERAVRHARDHRIPQEVEWTYTAVSASPLEPEPIQNEPLEAVALPGRNGWVGVLLQSRQSLEALREQQNRWISDVAHELRTPLTALALVSESLALAGEPGQEVLLDRLQRELDRLQQLVADLLELNRLEGDDLPGSLSDLTPVDLPALVLKAWQSLTPLAEPRGVWIELDSLSGSMVRGEESRLHRALLNLLDNALRYSPDQSPVEVRITRDSRWLRVEVRDHGAGFSDEDLRHMFERFYRGDPSRARGRQVGSGLGLAIVERIALAHGGMVRAGNHPAGGGQLRLSLPAAD